MDNMEKIKAIRRQWADWHPVPGFHFLYLEAYGPRQAGAALIARAKERGCLGPFPEDFRYFAKVAEEAVKQIEYAVDLYLEAASCGSAHYARELVESADSYWRAARITLQDLEVWSLSPGAPIV